MQRRIALFRYRWVIVFLVIAWGLFALWLYSDYVQKVSAEKASLRRQGEAILVALESGMGALSRLRDPRQETGEGRRSEFYRYYRDRRIEQLIASLNELTQNRTIFGVAILDVQGKKIVSSGEMEEWALALSVGNEEVWEKNLLLLTRIIDPRRSEWLRPGRRRAYLEPLSRPPAERPPEPPMPLYARLAMSQGELASVIRHHAKIALTACLVGLVAAVVLGVAWLIGIKNREQAAALKIAETQNQYLRELQLAGAGLAHEMRNPLSIVRASAQGMLEKGKEDDREHQVLERMLDEIDRVVSRLNGFLSFSRMPKSLLTRVDAKELVNQVASLLRHGMDRGDSEIHVENLPSIWADKNLFRQIVFNLLHNGVRAVESSGSLQVRANGSGPSTMRLEIADSGAGVPEELRDRLFRPYCSGWEGGAGLGLSIVRQLALAQGWQVGYRPNPDGGSIFWVDGIRLAEDEK